MTEFFTLIVLLAIVVVAAQALDLWTTYQVRRMGGRETNRLVLWFMDRIGVLPALVFLKTLAVGVALFLVFWAYRFPSEEPKVLAGMAFLTALYVFYMARNLRALKEQRQIYFNRG